MYVCMYVCRYVCMGVVWKVSDLANNLCETWDKRPLDRNPDRSWCHLHTSVKLYWSQPMAPWTSVVAYECAAAQSMDPWAATKKALHVAVTPGPNPTAACSEFHIGCRLGRELTTLHICCHRCPLSPLFNNFFAGFLSQYKCWSDSLLRCKYCTN